MMIVAQKVWEFRRNTIWDDGKYYILEHIPTGEKAYFDRTDRVLKAVQQKIKQRGSVIYNKGLNCFAFQSKKNDSIYLAQLLYSIYHHKSLSWVRNGRVRILDGNRNNLTSDNLVHTHEDADNNPNRCIYQVGNYIFLLHKKSGRTYFCKNDSELFKLLCDHRLVWDYSKKQNRLRATVVRNGHGINDLNPYFYQIVYAFEHYGARHNNFIRKIRKMQADLEKKELTIDHLDGIQENGMFWNLSLMTKSQNSAKNSMFSQVRFPFFLFAVYFENQYRIYCGRVHDPIAGVLDFSLWICATPDDLIDFLKNFLSTEWEDGLSPAKNLEEYPDAVNFQHYFGDFGASGIREELMVKSAEDFSVWKVEAN